MIYPNVRRKRSGAPILSRNEIDEIGEAIVGDFDPSLLQKPQEVDIDLLVQDYFGLSQDFQYLSHCGLYLGMTVFNDTDKVIVYNPETARAEYISERADTVIIDNSLLANNQEHRYRFTMGHEGAHGFLHKPYFAYDPNQLTLFDFGLGDRPREPMVQCRIDSKQYSNKSTKSWDDRDWMEWQANALSSSMLMPKSMVIKAVQDMECELPDEKNSRIRWWMMASNISELFNVSFESATIRLKDFGFIPKNENIEEDSEELLLLDWDSVI
jgi:Zn-dependent peptidase ImmA (M78 family)